MVTFFVIRFNMKPLILHFDINDTITCVDSTDTDIDITSTVNQAIARYVKGTMIDGKWYDKPGNVS
jgi:hypothetical protein